MRLESLKKYPSRSAVNAKNPHVLELFNEIKSQGYSCKAIAEQTGVCKVTVRNWGQGTTEPSITQFQRMADFLGYDFIVKKPAAISNNQHPHEGQQNTEPTIQEMDS